MFRPVVVQLTFLCALGAAVAGAQTLPETVPAGGDFAATATAPPNKLPEGALLVKGAEPSASDHATPVPEEGWVKKGVYQNRYFGIEWPLPEDWAESFKGPLPSDHGSYVLMNALPSASFKGPVKGTILFTAQDLFFSRTPAESAKELIEYRKAHLEPYYDVERAPDEITIAGRTFARFDYMSKVAGLHWAVLATQVRCHALQLVVTSRDPELIDSLVKDMNRMTLPNEAGAAEGKGGGDWPLCVPNYARPENMVQRVEPELKGRRFNDIPARIIIDKRGNVRYVHVISAFAEQSRVITNALMQWKFKPYVRDGKPAEVETGVMFGGPPSRSAPPGRPAVTAAKAE